MKYKLTKEEIKIEETAKKYVELNDKEKNELDKIISNTNLKKAITLRIKENDLEKIKYEAEKEGIPYQTLVSSIIHKYNSGKLIQNV